MFEQSQLESLPPEIAAALTSVAAQTLIAAQIEAAKTPLVQKRDELFAQLGESKKTLKQIEELGGLETLTNLRTTAQENEAARKAAELAAAEKNGDSERIKSHYAEQLAAKDKEMSDLRNSILQEKVSAKLNAAIREAKGVPELLEPHLKGRLKASMEDGKVKLTVLDENGIESLNKSVKDLVEEFRGNSVYGRAFEASAASGAGSRPSNATATGGNPWNPASKNTTEQMRMYRTDKAAAVRMAAEHGVQLD